MAGVIEISPVMMEVVVAVFGLATFFGAYFLLYRKDSEKGKTV